jgi:hypothetical protein
VLPARGRIDRAEKAARSIRVRNALGVSLDATAWPSTTMAVTGLNAAVGLRHRRPLAATPTGRGNLPL